MKRFSRILAGAAVISVWAVSVVAQPSCTPEDRNRIVSLSEDILAGRGELTGFAPPRYGTTAAYFLYHYGEMTDEAALAMFSRLSEGSRRQAVRLADDMAAALTVHMSGVEEGLSVLDPDPAHALVAAHSYTQRAVLRADNGASYFALVDLLRTDPGYEEIADDMRRNLQTVAFLIRDLPEDTLIAIAESAEAFEQFVPAGMILASLDDGFAQYEAFLARLPDDDSRDIVQSLVESTWMGEPSGGRYPFELRVASSEAGFANRMDLAIAMTANNRSGTFGWLGIYLNQSGQTEAAGRAGRTYLAALEAGELDPWRDMEEAWLFLYRTLRDEVDPASVALTLGGFDLSESATRHFAGRAMETLARMMMLEALSGGLTPDQQIADHPLMLRLQEEKDGILANPSAFMPADELEAQMAVELLWRDGQRDAAVTWAANWLEPAARLSFYRDVANRLDMGCDGILAYPGRALYLGGQALYSFPPVLRAEWE